MNEHTAEFTGQYRKAYGRYGNLAPDLARCAAKVSNGMFGYQQCSRANGNGPHGAWCKQHDPDARKAKSEARIEKWRAEYDTKDRLGKAIDALFTALDAIEAGHSDPRELAHDVLAELRAALEAMK